VPVWKLALVRVLGEHVAVLDFNRFTDSVGHRVVCEVLYDCDNFLIQVPRAFPKSSI
jgi:hypothetical protein